MTPTERLVARRCPSATTKGAWPPSDNEAQTVVSSLRDCGWAADAVAHPDRAPDHHADEEASDEPSESQGEHRDDHVLTVSDRSEQNVTLW
jgi:hypothetical protein